MKRYLLGFLLLLIGTTFASAHFAFIVPDDAQKAKAIFSDNLLPDKNVSIEKIANTKLFMIENGKEVEVKWTQDKDGNFYKIELPNANGAVVGGVTDFGVFQRGETKPMWLKYYPKAIFGPIPAPEKATLGNKVPLEIVPILADGKIKFLALAGGKPIEKTDVTVLIPGNEKGKVFTTDEKGLTEAFDKAGQYSALIRMIDAKEGEVNGKKYSEQRHYATLVVSLTAPK